MPDPVATAPSPDSIASGRLRLGISRCLMGEHVRYDGGHKLDPFLRDTLGRFVDYVPVCPEVECGLPVPREAMRLVGDPAAPRLLGISSTTDFTPQMQAWADARLESLAAEDLCGYIFKSKSPSSGMQRVKVYRPEGGPPAHNGVGIWARRFMERFPLLPVEDEGRLHDPGLRENFVERIFAMQRLRALLAGEKTPRRLSEFHARHKYQIYAHSEPLLRAMGRLVADAAGNPPEAVFAAYAEMLIQALQHKATTRKHVNVLTHLLGYFKKELSGDEKQELLELIARYARGETPLIVPITLVNHYVRKYDQPYLRQQWYLAPHPLELGLRNHV